jgi:phthalate 4,5-cis-dihydrodiol dehydrogenase
MTMRRLRLGVAGLGRAFTLMLPTFAADPRIALVAATDPRSEALERFVADFGGRAHSSIEALCADTEVDAIYLATPHELHAAHAVLAATHGKHLIVEKPMAITLDECRAMIDAAERGGVALIVGPSHSFDAPIRRTRALIEAGTCGALRMLNAQYYTDFLYRPRRPAELDTARGGGAVFSQAAHQVDMVRYLAGGEARVVRAHTGAWDPSRATEGAYAALVGFDDGIFASLVYSGYAHFDGDEWCGGIGEMGQRKDAQTYGAARRNLSAARTPGEEEALKRTRNYGGAKFARQAPAANHSSTWHAHFGLVIASCERADLRPLPNGVMIYGDGEARLDPLPPSAVPRVEVIDELHAAIVDGRRPLHDGRWGMATLEVCLAILESARTGREIALSHQIANRGPLQ